MVFSSRSAALAPRPGRGCAVPLPLADVAGAGDAPRSQPPLTEREGLLPFLSSGLQALAVRTSSLVSALPLCKRPKYKGEKQKKYLLKKKL